MGIIGIYKYITCIIINIIIIIPCEKAGLPFSRSSDMLL